MARSRSLAVTAYAVVVAATVGAGWRWSPELRGWPEPRMVTEAHFALNPSDPVARQAIARDAAWVSAGRDPGAGTRWATMSHRALMDLRRLMTPDGAPPAGAGAGWGFFWPRDGAFVAVALDRTGHPEEARRIIDFTARLPFDARRGFDARYQLGGGRVTQLARGPQSDGCGWVLWALGMIRAQKLKSFFGVLGVIIGVMFLITVVSVVEAKEPNTVHPTDVTPIVVYGE